MDSVPFLRAIRSAAAYLLVRAEEDSKNAEELRSLAARLQRLAAREEERATPVLVAGKDVRGVDDRAA